jgi:hypothetical protein
MPCKNSLVKQRRIKNEISECMVKKRIRTFLFLLKNAGLL